VAACSANNKDHGGRETRKSVSAKDTTLFIIKNVGADGANYKAIEYYGSAISELSMAERMTFATCQ